MLKLGTIDEFKSLVAEGRGFTKANLFYVKLPTINGINPYGLGLLCSDITLPSRQLTTQERVMGVSSQKTAYGYANTDVSMTFRILNDQIARSYFESWHDFIISQYVDIEGRWEARYPDQYMAPVHIYQLERGQSYPLFSKQFDEKLGPININIDIDLDIGTKAIANYHWYLDRAFPVSYTSSNLNEGDGEISTVSVDFSYQYWKGEPVDGKSEASISFNSSLIKFS